MNEKENIRRNKSDSTSIFEERSVETDYRTLIPLLKRGIRVLDVGCGTGAITRGLVKYIGDNGYAIGIDSEPAFIKAAQLKGRAFKNLKFIHQNFLLFEPVEKFDLVIAARTLQWLPDPKSAVSKLKQFLNPGGHLSVLDYNHCAIVWDPPLPHAMQLVYNSFLNWRSASGLNNRISENLSDYFKAADFENTEVFEADETYEKEHPNFMSKLGIWEKVGKLPQIVDEGYLEGETLKRALAVYGHWKRNKAQRMVLSLKEVRGALF